MTDPVAMQYAYQLLRLMYFSYHVFAIFREVETKVKKLLEKTEKSGQLSQEVRKCIQSASTLDDIETLAAQVPFINDVTSFFEKTK